MRRTTPTLIFVALAALGSLLLATSALAHSRPVRFDPAPGAVLDAAPDSVTGWFTSDLRRAEESFIRVLDHDGAEVSAGEIQLAEDRHQMSVALQPGLGEGRYVVHWSSFDDADGEIVRGCYAFFVGQAAADEAVANGESLDAAAECPASEGEHEHDDSLSGESTASIQIDVPETVSGDEVTVTIESTNFTARAPDGSTVDPNFGHYHIYLDKVPVDVLTGEHEHDEENGHGEGDDMAAMDEPAHPSGLAENPVMWVENSYTFSNLSPGIHTVTVSLNYDNHQPFDPPVIASRSFMVEGGSDDGGVPVWALVVGVAGGLVAGGLGMKLVGNRA